MLISAYPCFLRGIRQYHHHDYYTHFVGLSVRAGFQIEAVTFEMLKHSFYAIAVAIVLNSQRGYYTTNQV